MIIVASLVAALTYTTVSDDEVRTLARALLPSNAAVARSMGLGIEQISLAGHRYTYDGDIFDALELSSTQSFLDFDAKSAKARIEGLPWIATAELTRVYPGRLDVRVAERRPYAIWRSANAHHLIDETGRVLSEISGATLPDLPRLAGEGAPVGAKALLELLSRHPSLAGRLLEAERVGDRRWDLKLADGVTLKLPVDAEAKVLDDLARDAKLSQLAAGKDVTIDFRGPGRAAVLAPGGPHPGPGS